MEASSPNYVMVNPNRHRAESKATRAAVILLLLVSAFLTAVIAIGGASALPTGMQVFTFAWIILFLVMAFYIFRWSRGVLAMATALAILTAVLSIVASSGWFARDQAGFDPPLVPAGTLGLISIVLVPVLLLLVALSMRGFNQAWNVEVSVPEHEANENLADKFDEGGRRIEHDDDQQEKEGLVDQLREEDNQKLKGGQTISADVESPWEPPSTEEDDEGGQEAGADTASGGSKGGDQR